MLALVFQSSLDCESAIFFSVQIFCSRLLEIFQKFQSATKIKAAKPECERGYKFVDFEQ